MTEQKGGRWNPVQLPTVTLRCVDAESARRVVGEFPNRDRGGDLNTMAVDGDTVVITYVDKMWPYDIADWAGGMGLASDSDSARVFACL